MRRKVMETQKRVMSRGKKVLESRILPFFFYSDTAIFKVIKKKPIMKQLTFNFKPDFSFKYNTLCKIRIGHRGSGKEISELVMTTEASQTRASFGAACLWICFIGMTQMHCQHAYTHGNWKIRDRR